MANPEHSAKLIEGVESWNAWRKENPDVRPDLSGMYLSKMHLNHADFHDADLREVNLCEAVLRDTDFSGADLRGADVSDANLSDANLSHANFTEINLSNADLFRVNLRETDLSRSYLCQASFVEAHLNRVNLGRANLSEVDFFATDLSDADLHEANLSEANFFVTDLSRSNLCGAKLWGVELHESNLTAVNLANSNMWLSHLNRCNLTDAIFENAVVKDLRLNEMKGQPQIPSRLRLDEEGRELLTGRKAQDLFLASALVELYLDSPLAPIELTCLQLYLIHLEQSRIASGVRFFYHQNDIQSTVLCFQASAYEKIYSCLPDLLAPFQQSRFIDWKETLSAISSQERNEGMAKLVNSFGLAKEMARPLAIRIAGIFPHLHTVRITCIKHAGNGPRFHIKIVQKTVETRRIEETPVPDSDDSPFLMVALSDEMGIYLVRHHAIDCLTVE
ncbi:MAG: pentapeptide repeat-containing protein [Candidatus Omnitrophota bacterium]|jgi:uncharacterized protein YjbI with pentapeptide repeats|nr:MAG: pentapeptide repeat-containing protein [Candidatus Omnitrophota bacterium]